MRCELRTINYKAAGCRQMVGMCLLPENRDELEMIQAVFKTRTNVPPGVPFIRLVEVQQSEDGRPCLFISAGSNPVDEVFRNYHLEVVKQLPEEVKEVHCYFVDQRFRPYIRSEQ